MKYKHIFFDFDHTLWDFETNAKDTFRELYELNNLYDKGIYDFEIFFEKYSYHNERLWSRYAKGFIKQEELKWKRNWHTLLEFKIADEALAKSMSVQFLERLPYKKQLFPYAEEILQYLKSKGYKLHLITNGFEKVQHTKLRQSNLSHYFDVVVTSEGSNSLKPQPEIFEYAFAKTQAQKFESIMIGDNPEADIQGAINSKIDSVLVNHTQKQILNEATYTVYHLKELENIF